MNELFSIFIELGCTQNEALFLLGVACVETAGLTKTIGNNLGNIQATGWHGSTNTIVDCRADGSKYTVKIRAYATIEEGAADLIKAVFVWKSRDTAVRRLAKTGEFAAAVLGMKRTKYFEANAENYLRQLFAWLKKFQLEKPIGCGRTLLDGDVGEDVRQFNRLSIGIDVDRLSGKLVQAWQKRAGVTVDGSVGPESWARLLLS